MRHGAEVKVGLITLLAIALLAVFTYYVRGSLSGRHTYTVFVTFANARGLQQGDSVRMVGKKIGEVVKVGITPPPLKAQVMLLIDKQYPVFKNYTFQIAAAGLFQERSIEVIPTAPGAEGLLLADQATVPGEAAPDLADMLRSAEGVMASFQGTAEQLQEVLGNKDLLAGVQRALASFADAADAGSRVAEITATLAERTEPEVTRILAELGQASSDLQETTGKIRQTIAEGTALDDMEATAGNVRELSKHLAEITGGLDELTSAPETKQELRESLAAIHDAAASLKRIGADMEVFSGELKKAAPSVPKVAKEAEQLTATVAGLQESLKPPSVHADFRVLYSGGAGRSFSTGNLDFSYPQAPRRFLRLGVDDIGEESNANVQLGEHQRTGSLRYGLVRSRLGLGFDFDLPRRGRLSVDLFDPNSLRSDVLLQTPLGRSDWALLMGGRDLGKDDRFVIGAQVRK